MSEAERLLSRLAMAEPGGDPGRLPSEGSEPGGESHRLQQLEAGAASEYQEVWPRSDPPGGLGKRGSQSQAPY